VHVNDLILFQDNMSAILLEKNGHASASKWSRHMNIWYFFIADRAKSGELQIEYCPTEELLGNFFSKPLQGGQFYIIRDDIMNVDPQSRCKDAMMTSLQPMWPQMVMYAKEDHISKCWWSEHQCSCFEFY
jgi:hypothetical protein